MTTKLTLTVNKKVVSVAKKFAEKRGKSLSGMVENYLKAVTEKESLEKPLSPRIAKLMGSVKLPEDFDYKAELSKAINRKYSK